MRDLSKCKRIVIKIGTNTLAKGSVIDTGYIREMAGQVKELIKAGRQVVIVTSGSIGMGAGRLGLTKKVTQIDMRQACAAIGQPVLMHEYSVAFSGFDLMVGQVLLTASELNNRKAYINLRNAMETLLKLGIIPVLNENDCVSTAEIGNAFGDNDRLSAYVASKIDADLLIMLSDIDALYDKDPRTNPDAKPIPVVTSITDEILAGAGSAGSSFSTGGMKTKIYAAQILQHTGCLMVLSNGRVENVITKIVSGESIGTLFVSDHKLSNKIRWILNAKPAGFINVDDGAMEALKSKKSLLPSGIVSVDGIFPQGSVISINKKAKAIIDFSSEELKIVAGKHSSEIRKLLGPEKRDVIAIPEEIVFLD